MKNKALLITIILASALITTGLIFFAMSNRFYVSSSGTMKIDRLTGTITYLTPPKTISDEKDKTYGDISKIIVNEKHVAKTENAFSGSTDKMSRVYKELVKNCYNWKFTLKVVNNDTYSHVVDVVIVRTDKENNPVDSETFNVGTIMAGGEKVVDLSWQIEKKENINRFSYFAKANEKERETLESYNLIK